MTLEELTTTVLRSCAPFSEGDRAIIRAAYRTLADGIPASMERLAERAECSVNTVKATFARWPGLARVDRTETLQSILGLSVSPTVHRFEVDGRTLYAWCAWDTLFIPRVLQATARVHSRCPVSGRPVHLLVTPDGPAAADPAGIFVSFVTASCDYERGGNTVGVCCEHVHFLATEQAAEGWRREHPGGTVLTLADAAELARVFVETSLALPIASHRQEVK